MLSPRSSCSDETKRDIPSFIEARPPLVLHPMMRPRPQKGKKLFGDVLEDSEIEELELVQVYLRLKPCNTPSNHYEVLSERSLITSLDTTTAGHGRRTQHNVSKMYTFSHIFGPDSSQKEIFERVVKDNLKKLPEGDSFTLLTYGASGSGKTFTLMGTVSSPGLVPRSLEYVFRVVDAAQEPLYKPDERGAVKLSYAAQEFELKFVRRLRLISAPVRGKYRRMSAALGADLTGSAIDLTNRRSHYVWVSFIEIYNEGIYDLLAPGDRKNAAKLAIREDTSGNVYVKGATQAFVRTGEEAYDVLVAGKHNLQVAATGIHAQSSRSHCIFTITMLTETEGGTRSACVRLCDLAGCERAARTRNTGARMQESRAINSSLHVLERCLRALRGRRTAATLVPYRESKLTRLLGAGLSGARGEAVSMVVTLNPSPEYANETRHVLQLAAVAKDIQINDTQLTEYPSTFESSSQDTTIGYNSFEVMKLRADNERLLFELKQAEACNKDLAACLEETRAANEKVLWEVIDDSKAINEQYCEARLKAMQTKMDDMKEDYESRLEDMKEEYENRLRESEASQLDCGDTSVKKYQKQIAQLMTDITILEEKLSAEQLARARLEEEVQHLRTCIDERDENADDVISLTDSDNDSEDDTYNESLEPTFRKEDINRSRIIRQSIIADINNFKRASRVIASNLEESDLEKSTNSIKDDGKTCESNVETYLTSEELNNTDIMNESDRSSVGGEEFISTVKKATIPSRCTYVVDNVTISGLGINDDSVNDDIANEPITNEQKEITEPQHPLSSESNCVATSEVLNMSNVDNLQDEIPKSVTDNSFKDLNVSKDIKSPEINDISKSLKDDMCTDINIISKCIDVQEQNEISKSLENDTSKDLHISKGIKLQEQNENSNLLNDDRLKDLNISKNIQLLEQKEVSQSLKLKNIKENDIYKVSEISNSLTETVKIPTKTEIHATHKILPNTYARKIMDSITHSPDSNNSLLQFERLEMETGGIDEDKKIVSGEFYNIKYTKEKRIFFDEDCLGKCLESSATVGKTKDKKIISDNSNVEKNKIQDNLNKYTKTPVVSPEEKNKFLGKIITRQADKAGSVKKLIISSKPYDSIDLFEDFDSPRVKKDETQTQTADGVPKSIKKMAISDKTTFDSADSIETKSNEINYTDKIEMETCKEESVAKVTDIQTIAADKIVEGTSKMDIVVANESNLNNNPLETFNKDKSHAQANCTNINNTTEEFDNIYKDISASRVTEFDLLVSQESTEENHNNNDENSETEHSKMYNLRQKSQSKRPNTERKRGKNKVSEAEILLESQKCERKSKPTRRNLRLCRQKVVVDDEKVEEGKLKDIVNLQSEFSDVTLDVPAPVKAPTDIPSPEKVEDEENRPLGVQSCPAKSVTRSRRKLYTPRVEPLEESLAGTGDSSDKVRVPRPSYHRPRARRKL